MEEESIAHPFLPSLTRWVMIAATVFFAVSGFMPREQQNKIRLTNVDCRPEIFPSKPVCSDSDNKDGGLHEIIVRTAGRHEVDPALVKAIIRAESGYNPRAISKKGAMGLMQLMPGTAESLGVEGENILNPENNIDAGVKYLKQLLVQFHGNIRLAVAAYNAGTNKVIKYKGVPPYEATRCYVDKVLEYYRHYKEKPV